MLFFCLGPLYSFPLLLWHGCQLLLPLQLLLDGCDLLLLFLAPLDLVPGIDLVLHHVFNEGVIAAAIRILAQQLASQPSPPFFFLDVFFSNPMSLFFFPTGNWFLWGWRTVKRVRGGVEYVDLNFALDLNEREKGLCSDFTINEGRAEVLAIFEKVNGSTVHVD